MAIHDVAIQTIVPATDELPRNMGADIIGLQDGRLLLAFSQWLGGTSDHDCSRVMGMLSDDGGRSWGEPFPILAPCDEFESVRMPSMAHLDSGVVLMLVRCRTSLTESWVGMVQLQPAGEGAGSPRRITPPPPGRHIALNNRLVRLSTGRLLLPLSSPWPWDREDVQGLNIRSWSLLSDDDGASWAPSESMLAGSGRGLMEPYVVELRDGRLRMLIRTGLNRQYESLSEDGGRTWSAAVPAPDLLSPESPAAARRDPGTGRLVVVWNHGPVGGHGWDRTPLTVGFSDDEGESWTGFVDLETDPQKAYSYPGLSFIGGRAYVTYYEGVNAPSGNRLSLKLCSFVVEEA